MTSATQPYLPGLGVFTESEFAGTGMTVMTLGDLVRRNVDVRIQLSLVVGERFAQFSRQYQAFIGGPNRSHALLAMSEVIEGLSRPPAMIAASKVIEGLYRPPAMIAASKVIEGLCRPPAMIAASKVIKGLYRSSAMIAASKVIKGLYQSPTMRDIRALVGEFDWQSIADSRMFQPAPTVNSAHIPRIGSLTDATPFSGPWYPMEYESRIVHLPPKIDVRLRAASNRLYMHNDTEGALMDCRYVMELAAGVGEKSFAKQLAKLELPPDIKTMIIRARGYESNRGAHPASNGTTPSFKEAEFILEFTKAVVPYLLSQHDIAFLESHRSTV